MDRQPTVRTIRYVNGRPMFWRGHRVESTLADGSDTYSYRTICGEDAPLGYLSCGDDSLTCMACALALDREKLP